MEEELKAIGIRIKELRRERHITQKELAGALNISHTNMCNIENGKTAVTIQNLLKLKRIFSCPMSDFFAEEQTVKAEQKPVQVDEPKEEFTKLPESIDLQDAINLVRLLRRVDIRGI